MTTHEGRSFPKGNSFPSMSLPEQEQLLENSQFFHIKGTDSTGRYIIRIVGKFFPGRKWVQVEVVLIFGYTDHDRIGSVFESLGFHSHGPKILDSADGCYMCYICAYEHRRTYETVRCSYGVRLNDLDVKNLYAEARALNVKVWKKYMEEKVFPALGQQPFCLVYLHTHVQSSKNSPGISILRSINEALPITVKNNLEAIYFVHPDLQTRLFMATFGRFLLSRGWYEKLRFINRLEFLWEHVRRGEVEIPEFVYHHDEDLVHRPLMDQGLQRDRH